MSPPCLVNLPCQAPTCSTNRYSAPIITRLNASDGSVSRRWGSFGSGNCDFFNPNLAVDSAGNVLVSMMGCAGLEGTRHSAAIMLAAA